MHNCHLLKTGTKNLFYLCITFSILTNKDLRNSTYRRAAIPNRHTDHFISQIRFGGWLCLFRSFYRISADTDFQLTEITELVNCMIFFDKLILFHNQYSVISHVVFWLLVLFVLMSSSDYYDHEDFYFIITLVDEGFILVTQVLASYFRA